MITADIRSVVRTLAAQGRPLREISRLLKLSVTRCEQSCAVASERPGAPWLADTARREQLEPLFERARDNVVRVQEMLAAEQRQPVPYSTLTRWVREVELREPPSDPGVCLGPASESQHDTSPTG